mgnify:CR=1 FL=1
MIAYIFRLPDGHRLLPHRNLTSPHSDGKAFSLPATLTVIYRFNARTSTKRKVSRQSVPYPAEPTTACLRHEPDRSFCPGRNISRKQKSWRACHSVHLPFVSGSLFIQLSRSRSLWESRATVTRSSVAFHKPFHF